MNTRSKLALAAIALSSIASAASAASVYNLTVRPSDIGTGAYAAEGGAIGTSAAGAPGYGSTAFSATVNAGAATVNERYVTFRILVSGDNGLFGPSGITVGDLDAFSYFTNTAATGANQLDWKVTIYTALTGSLTKDFNAVSNPNGNAGTFYHSRLQTLPVSDNNGVFNQLSTSNLIFTETNLSNGVQSGGVAWSAIQDGSSVIQRPGGSPSSIARDFRAEQISYIDFTLGTSSLNQSTTGTGALDGISFSLANGDIYNLNLEAAAAASVPLPTSALAASTLLSLSALRRRR